MNKQAPKNRVVGVFAFVLVLAACGGTPKPGSLSGLVVFPGTVGVTPSPTPTPPAPPPAPTIGPVSGTVSVPSGEDVAGTIVFLCSSTGSCANAKTTTINTTGGSAAYSIAAVASGPYQALAWNDIDGSGAVDNGDFLGCYNMDAQGNCGVLQAPATGINIGLEVYVASAPTQPLQRLQSTLVQPEFVPGDVIVKFRNQASRTSTQSISVQGITAQGIGGQGGGTTLSKVRDITQAIGSSVTTPALYRNATLNAAQTVALVAQLQARPDVLYAEPNYISHLFKTPNDTLYSTQWHYKAMNLENAWDITDGTTGTPITVAVVDTGAITHSDLQGVFVGGYDFITDPDEAGDGNARDPDPKDLGGDSGYHGSHVAGTIAAKSNNGAGVAGVSWGAKVVPVRVLGINGSGSNSDILEAVQWAAGIPVAGVPNNPNPAKVINLSLGGKRACSQAEQDIYAAVKAKGAIVVVAAGNSNDDATQYSPASCNNVITVGATGPKNTRAPYSNYGAPLDVMAPGGDTAQFTDIAGKRVPLGVWSTILNDAGQEIYAAYQGTSMAAPHVAGLVALMLSRDANLGFDTVLARLKAASSALNATQCNRPSGTDCGPGLVDAVKALNPSAPTPTPPAPTPPAPPPPPVAGNVSTYVAGLHCANANCDLFDYNKSTALELKQTTGRADFTLGNLAPGSYRVGGWQDLNGDQQVSPGEPFGFDSRIIALASGQDLGGAVIRLQPYTAAIAENNAMSQTLREAFTQIKQR